MTFANKRWLLFLQVVLDVVLLCRLGDIQRRLGPSNANDTDLHLNLALCFRVLGLLVADLVLDRRPAVLVLEVAGLLLLVLRLDGGEISATAWTRLSLAIVNIVSILILLLIFPISC